MDAQEEHDQNMPEEVKLNPGSRKKLENMLRRKNRNSPPDPVASAIRNHPTLTPEKVEQQIKNLGF